MPFDSSIRNSRKNHVVIVKVDHSGPLTTKKGVLAARVATTRQKTAVLPLRLRDQCGLHLRETHRVDAMLCHGCNASLSGGAINDAKRNTPCPTPPRPTG